MMLQFDGSFLYVLTYFYFFCFYFHYGLLDVLGSHLVEYSVNALRIY